MLPTSRNVAFVVLAALALGVTGCGGNSKKIVGKWKIVSVGGEKEKGDDKAIPCMEFKSDGNATFGIEISDAKAKELFGDGFNFNFKYKVTGDTIELSEASKDGKKGPFGKSDKAKATIKFDGDDNLTITPDEEKDKPLKLTRMK